MSGPRAVLLDIEGTISSIAFVKEVLFPYARRALPAFVRERAGDDTVRRWLDQAARQLPGIPTDEVLVQALQRWIDDDRKDPALKALQGLMWKAGYEQGLYRSHIYPDVPPRLRAWKQAGHALFVFSSGSVLAQRLFFAHSEAGDLTPLFDGYFDSETGNKRDVTTYARIAELIGRAAPELLFLSDIVEELDAAREARLGTLLVDRVADYAHPRTGPYAHGHMRVVSFAAVPPG